VESKGALWVAEEFRVPEIQSLRLSEYRLQPEADLRDETPDLTPEERKQVEELLSARETVYRGSSYRGFETITLVRWSPFLGGSNPAHPSHDGKGLDRCKGESGTGVVCFGGNFMTSITGLRIR
jgi:hypothetical protein